MNARLIGINSAIYSQIGRQHRHRLRHPGQHGEERSIAAAQSAAAMRCGGPGSAPRCRASRATSPTASGSTGRPARWSPTCSTTARPREAGLKRGDVITAVDGQASTIRTPSATGSAHGRSAPPSPLVGVGAAARAVDLPMKLISAPEMPPREPVTIHNTRRSRAPRSSICRRRSPKRCRSARSRNGRGGHRGRATAPTPP